MQDRSSELINSARTMDRKEKKEELNIKEQQYKDNIIPQKRGPKVKDFVEQHQGVQQQ